MIPCDRCGESVVLKVVLEDQNVRQKAYEVEWDEETKVYVSAGLHRCWQTVPASADVLRTTD